MRTHRAALGILTLTALSLCACTCWRGHSGDRAATASTGRAEYVAETNRAYDTPAARAGEDRYEPETGTARATPAVVRAPDSDRSMWSTWDSMTSAVAKIVPTDGNTCRGTVRFTKTDGSVRIVADVEGLAPNKTFGFHIHEFGDCTSATGESAGGHFNPTHESHGGPDAAVHHAGDLGNLMSDADGRAHYDRTVTGLSIAGHEDSIVGRSVVVHQNADDLTTQPSGNSGPRIGCGAIGLARPSASMSSSQ